MMERLQQICGLREIRYIIVDALDIPDDTAFYSGALKVIFASKHLTDKTIQVIIDLLEGRCRS